MKKVLVYLFSFSLIFILNGCKEKDTLLLNEKYTEYYDKDNQKYLKEIIIEYGEAPSLELDDYLSKEKEITEDTTITLHEIKDGLMVEEAITIEKTLEIGDYYLIISNGKEEIKLFVTVKDRIAPEFVKFSEVVEFQEGDEVDLTEFFDANDLSKVEITVEGEVNFYKPGDYQVNVIATDISENKTKQECTIKINKKPETKPSNNITINKPSDISKVENESDNFNDKKEESNKAEIVIPESYYIPKFNQQVFDMINEKRIEAGISQLSYNSTIQYIADERAKEVVNDWSHDGLKKYEKANNCDYGEILTYGYGTPSEVITGWMNSSGHKNAMLADYNLTASVSAYYDGYNNSIYWVVVFTH